MSNFNGTPGRRSTSTINQAVTAALQSLEPLAQQRNTKASSMVRWSSPLALRVVFTAISPVATQFKVRPKTLLEWARAGI